MNSNPTAGAGPPGTRQMDAELPKHRALVQHIKGRMIGGLLLVLPILITLWVIYWLYSTLEKNVVDPIALLVLWKARRGQAETELP